MHINNMTILASSSAFMAKAKAKLETMFNIKKLGEIDQLLGMEITRHSHSSIFLSQTQYITKILEHFQMHNSNPVTTPMDPHVKLMKTLDSENYPEIKHVYQNMVGSLMYATISTHPGISFAVQTLS
jgi:muramidase (phage lysozyme)